MIQSYRRGFLNFSTVDICSDKSLLTVLCIAGFSAESLASTHKMRVDISSHGINEVFRHCQVFLEG